MNHLDTSLNHPLTVGNPHEITVLTTSKIAIAKSTILDIKKGLDVNLE